MASKKPRILLYMRDEDKANMERLLAALIALGYSLRDQRGDPSYSAMVRYLVEDALRKLERV